MSTNPAFASIERNLASGSRGVLQSFYVFLKNPPACEPAKRVAVETARAAVPPLFPINEKNQERQQPMKTAVSSSP
ncbi:hypothetical protein CEXT_447271 [Caerostris extrusa]|uniref:Uncharacterized protein n=1 Tax=Caerostris extrusa TaxID=172846 RepID=A0AAV4VU63_CAEEX|nr:hypothetical protein CEXT_447271 [Caerostris extrusa]